MEIPQIKKMCQAERFAVGLKLLAEECGMTSIEYNKLGMIISYEFDDGSSIGSWRAHKEAELIKGDL